MAVAKELKLRAVVIGIWDPKSASEFDQAAKLVNQFRDDFALGVVVGNERITFGRYETSDVRFATERLRSQIPAGVPIATSEPSDRYHGDSDEATFLRGFGDFLAPNVHSVFNRPGAEPAEAAAWTRGEAITFAHLTGKPVLVEETGVLPAGKPGFKSEAQAAFWRAYLADGLVVGPDATRGACVSFAAAFEAYDLPW